MHPRSKLSLYTPDSKATLYAELNLPISDNGAHGVKMFSKDRTYLHSVGREGYERGILDRLKGCTLTKDLNLVTVFENIRFGLQIFSYK